jgi:hypothetical protein
MRTRYLTVLAAVGLTASAVAAAADANQTAVWEQRTLRNFTLPLIANSETGPLREASCDQLYVAAKVLLLQLGARSSDMRVDQRGCQAYTTIPNIDVTFWALAPATEAKKKTAGPVVEAHWETVQLRGNCVVLQEATKIMLPLFATSDVKLISSADCARIGVGIYGKVLKAPAEQASSP